MSSDHPPQGRGEPATGPVRVAHETWPAPELEEDEQGGDPSCWAGLVCQECGAVISEGHRSGCSHREAPGRGSRSSTLAECGLAPGPNDATAGQGPGCPGPRRGIVVK